MSSDTLHYQASSAQKAAALILPCYAYIGILGIPMSFGAIIEKFSVNPATATAATTAEILCISLASLFVSMALSFLQPRITIVGGLALIILGQLLTINTIDFTTLILMRGVTGIGEGLCIAMSLATLAQMQGGTRLLSYTSGLTAALTLCAFLVVPALQESVGVNSIFWFMLVGAVICIPFGLIFSSARIARLVDNITVGKAFNLRSVSLFGLCLLTSLGANTCWLYFEQVGETAGISAAQIGIIGSVSMLFAILVPVAANIAFSKSRYVTPLIVVCLLMAVTSYLYVIPNVPLFWFISISMTFLYAFATAYARMYSSDFDSSGRTTAAVGGADSLGMVIGPVLAALTLNLDSGFKPLGDFGVIMQLLCIVPGLFIIMAYRNKSKAQAIH